MKIILLQDVPKIGKKYDVKEVANGLARNFLIPQKLVEMATPQAIKNIETLRAKNLQEIEKKDKEFSAALESLGDSAIIIKAKASEQGSLFRAVTEKDIAETLEKQYQIKISPSSVAFDEPIKKMGEYDVTIGDKNTKKIIKISIKSSI
ncbi:MAG: 50S ribosomal protein L9 [bacterium]|nr:50S ribosomal protein L9 [bacterium]